MVPVFVGELFMESLIASISAVRIIRYSIENEFHLEISPSVRWQPTHTSLSIRQMPMQGDDLATLTRSTRYTEFTTFPVYNFAVTLFTLLAFDLFAVVNVTTQELLDLKQERANKHIFNFF